MRDTGFHGPLLPFQEDIPNLCEASVDSPTRICLLVMPFLQDVIFTAGQWDAQKTALLFSNKKIMVVTKLDTSSS